MALSGNNTARVRTYDTQYNMSFFFYQQVVPNRQEVAKDDIHFSF